MIKSNNLNAFMDLYEEIEAALKEKLTAIVDFFSPSPSPSPSPAAEASSTEE